MQNLEGKRVLVAGFARSGRAAADFLQSRGAVVTVSDSRPPWSFASDIPDLLARKIGVEFGQHGAETFGRQDLVVTSPGIPWELPALAAARERGIPVVAEVEAASWFFKGSLVGVTGSNGKTTTTALLGRMLQESGFQASVGGNIGVPLISMVAQSTAETVAVVELSSFQLEGTESMEPLVAIMLNITPNHLDRHPSLESYVEAKARILRNQTEKDYAVLNADDPTVAGLAERGSGRKIFFSCKQDIPEGLLVSGGQVVYRVGHLQRDLFSPGDVKLRGDFNLENVLAASAAACVLGADFDAIARAVREFRGVEHRLEFAGDVLGVEFYNDSKATSVDATVKALGAFDRGVHLILGGKDKGAPYAPLIPLLNARVREVLLIGAAAERIGRELAGTVDLVTAGDLETAVRQAFSRGRPGDVILLSPACASFDQFRDFEDRGRRFKQLVESLAQEGNVARLRRAWVQAGPRAHGTQPQAGPGPDASARENAPPLFELSPPPVAPARTVIAGPATVPVPSLQKTASEEPPASPPESPASSRAPVPVHIPSGTGRITAAAQSDLTVAPLVAPPAAHEAESRRAATEATRRQEVQAERAQNPDTAAEARINQSEQEVERESHPPLTERAATPERELERSDDSSNLEPTKTTGEQGRPERIYVYELEAEERQPIDSGEAYSIDDVVLTRGPESGPDLNLKPAPGERGASPRLDEPLIFEITTETKSAGSGPDARKPGNAQHQSGPIARSGEEQTGGKRARYKKVTIGEIPKE